MIGDVVPALLVHVGWLVFNIAQTMWSPRSKPSFGGRATCTRPWLASLEVVRRPMRGQVFQKLARETHNRALGKLLLACEGEASVMLG